jgi:hypothetical protein
MMQKIYAAFEKFIHINQTGENKMNFNELTTEQLEVTPEQLRRSVRVMPWEASKYYCEEDLAGKKLECCEEKTK